MFYVLVMQYQVLRVRPLKVVLDKMHSRNVIWVFLMFVSSLSSSPLEHDSQLEGRIVGGSQVQPGQYPWQVSLQITSLQPRTNVRTHFCSGVLIHPRFVLTAAHCIYLHSARTSFFKTSTLRIMMGTLDRVDSDAKDFGIAKVISHKFNRFTMENDIALLMLEESADSIENLKGRVGYAQLPPANFVPQGNCTVSGWGHTDRTDGVMSKTLMAANVPYVPFQNCKKSYVRLGFLLDGMLCAGDTTADACQFDSGGPLMCFGTPIESATNKKTEPVNGIHDFDNMDSDMYLTGIVSWGNGCANPGYPGIYADVSKYVPWIMENIVNNLAPVSSTLINALAKTKF